MKPKEIIRKTLGTVLTSAFCLILSSCQDDGNNTPSCSGDKVKSDDPNCVEDTGEIDGGSPTDGRITETDTPADTNTEDSDTENQREVPCECSSGPCCDGCNFYSLAQQIACETQYSYDCNDNGCGADAVARKGTRICQGDTSECSGDLIWESGWYIEQFCSSEEICQTDGASFSSCLPCEHGCVWGGCYPECNPLIDQCCLSDGTKCNDTCIDGVCQADCDPTKDPCCGAPSPAISGTFNSDVANVQFKTAEVLMEHALDIDEVENGCISKLTIVLTNGNSCSLHIVADSRFVWNGGLKVSEVKFFAGSSCAGFPNADEGIYNGVDDLEIAEVVFQTKQLSEDAGDAFCINDVLQIKLKGEILDQSRKRSLILMETNITIAGSFPSFGSSLATCPCMPDCTNKQCGDDGCGGSCGMCEHGCSEEQLCFAECNPEFDACCKPDGTLCAHGCDHNNVCYPDCDPSLDICCESDGTSCAHGCGNNEICYPDCNPLTDKCCEADGSFCVHGCNDNNACYSNCNPSTDKCCQSNGSSCVHGCDDNNVCYPDCDPSLDICCESDGTSCAHGCNDNGVCYPNCNPSTDKCCEADGTECIYGCDGEGCYPECHPATKCCKQDGTKCVDCDGENCRCSPGTDKCCREDGTTISWYDETTGLCWQNPPSESKIAPLKAEEYCESLGSGWRVPTIDELRSLIRPETASPNSCSENVVGGACGVTALEPTCLLESCADNCRTCSFLNGTGYNGCYWPISLKGNCSMDVRYDPYISSSMLSNSSSYRWAINYDMGRIVLRIVQFKYNLRCVQNAD